MKSIFLLFLCIPANGQISKDKANNYVENQYGLQKTQVEVNSLMHGRPTLTSYIKTGGSITFTNSGAGILWADGSSSTTGASGTAVSLTTTIAYTDLSNVFIATQTILAQDSSGYSFRTSTGISLGGCVKFGDATQQCSAAVAVSSTSPGGANKQVQFNSLGNFAGSSGLTWNNTVPRTLTVDDGSSNIARFTISGGEPIMGLIGNCSLEARALSDGGGIRFNSYNSGSGPCTGYEFQTAGTTRLNFDNVGVVAMNPATGFEMSPGAGANMTIGGSHENIAGIRLNVFGGTQFGVGVAKATITTYGQILTGSSVTASSYNIGTKVAFSSVPIMHVGGALTANLTSGVTFFSFVPDASISLRRITSTIQVAGIAGSGDTIRCNDSAGTGLEVTSAAAAAAGTSNTAVGVASIAYAGQVFCHIESGAATKPNASFALEYVMN